MAHGLYHGVKHGVIHGIRHQGALTTLLPGVARDDASGIYCPANSAQWATVMAAAGITSGGPSLLWSCQENNGTLLDSIGIFHGTATGAPLTYRQPVAGWSRFGIQGFDASSAVFTNSDTTLPDPATTSMLSMGYVIITSPGAGINFMCADGGGTATFDTFTNTTTRYKLNSNGNVTTGTVDPSGVVRPFAFQYDVTNNRAAAFSNQEVLTTTKGATTTKMFRLSVSQPSFHLYRVAFFGAAAELSNAQVKRLYQTLGWTVAW